MYDNFQLSIVFQQLKLLYNFELKFYLCVSPLFIDCKLIKDHGHNYLKGFLLPTLTVMQKKYKPKIICFPVSASRQLFITSQIHLTTTVLTTFLNASMWLSSFVVWNICLWEKYFFSIINVFKQTLYNFCPLQLL